MKAVVLLSGGLDSTVLLHYVIKKLKKNKIYVLSFNYGQKHSKELECAKYQVNVLKENIVEHKIVDITFFKSLINGASTLVTGGTKVPDLDELSEQQREQPPTYVPNRNMMMLSIASAYAESMNCTEIYYGAQAQDEYGYWDCTRVFLTKINEVLNLNRKNKIRVLAPFIDKAKHEEVAIGRELGVNFSKTWSCYKGGEEPCGTCPTCIERITAFNIIGGDVLGGTVFPLPT